VTVGADGTVRVGRRVAGRLRLETVAPGVQMAHEDGVRFVPEQIRPTRDPAVYTQYRDTAFTSLRLQVTDRAAFRPVYTTLVLLSEAKKQAPQRFRIQNTGFTQMIGSRWAREAFDRGENPRVIQQRWDQEMQQWLQQTRQYRLYRTE